MRQGEAATAAPPEEEFGAWVTYTSAELDDLVLKDARKKFREKKLHLKAPELRRRGRLVRLKFGGIRVVLS